MIAHVVFSRVLFILCVSLFQSLFLVLFNSLPASSVSMLTLASPFLLCPSLLFSSSFFFSSYLSHTITLSLWPGLSCFAFISRFTFHLTLPLSRLAAAIVITMPLSTSFNPHHTASLRESS